METTTINVKYPNWKHEPVLRCECCNGRAEVMSVYGEYERHLCAMCYIKEELPHMNVIMTDGNANFNGAHVGQSYFIERYSYDEHEPVEYGWKGCSHLKKIADKVLYLGDEEYDGKRHKIFEVVLKPEYQGMRGTGWFHRVYGLSALENNSRRWMATLLKIAEKSQA